MLTLSGAAIVDLDWMVDFGMAAQLLPEKGLAGWPPAQNEPGAENSTGALSICGNFDPVRVMLQGTPDEVYRATWANLTEGGSRCISAAGCEIPTGTPPENIHAQNRALRAFCQSPFATDKNNELL
jgi:uroporphyrinogen decarboxylase